VTPLKFAGAECKRKGYDVCCIPGIGIEGLCHQVEKTDLKTECPDVIVIHAGTNLEYQLPKLWGT
jgi:hypothetical protein